MPGAARQYINYILEFPNGKKYVGYTGGSIEDRIKVHYRVSKNPERAVAFAIAKYKEFKTEVVASFEIKQEALDNEKRLVIEHNSHISQNGYNLTWGGETPPTAWDGRQWMIGKTPEQIKEINKKKSCPGEKNGFFGKRHDPETLKRAVETRRKNGSYHGIKVEYNGIKFDSKRDLSKFLGVVPRTVDRMIRDGEIKCLEP